MKRFIVGVLFFVLFFCFTISAYATTDPVGQPDKNKCYCDFNKDGVVDDADREMLLPFWNQPVTKESRKYDIQPNDIIDLVDWYYCIWEEANKDCPPKGGSK